MVMIWFLNWFISKAKIYGKLNVIIRVHTGSKWEILSHLLIYTQSQHNLDTYSKSHEKFLPEIFTTIFIGTYPKWSLVHPIISHSRRVEVTAKVNYAINCFKLLHK